MFNDYKLGMHTPFSGKIHETLLFTISSGSTATQFFMGSPQSFKRANITEEVNKKLLEFAKNSENGYNERADATDHLLQYGSQEYKDEAKIIIQELGKREKTELESVYTNKQNVHSENIEKSVLKCLEFLQTFDLLKVKGKDVDFYYVEEQIKNLVSLWGLQEKEINISLNRIFYDRSLYGSTNITLVNVLLRIWTYLSNHKDEESIKKRLLEELTEMAYTCSSGFLSRLVNTISGFGDFSIVISWREQIQANFIGRINARIRDMDDLDKQEKILEEVMIDPKQYEKRKNLLKFYSKNLPYIREEMALEFKDYISDTDFDLYFRSATSFFESGE